MGTEIQRVSVSLSKQDALRFKKLSKKEKELFTKMLSNLINDEDIDMKTVMEFISYRAQKKGLTPEILEQILKEENP